MGIATIVGATITLGKEKIRDLIIDLGLEVGKNQLLKKKSEHEIRESLQLFIEKETIYNEICSLSEEIDFEGLINYLKGSAIDDVRKRLGASKSKERAVARDSLRNRAIAYAKADTKESQDRVWAIVDKVTTILRQYYIAELGYGDLFLAAMIEDDISETISITSNKLNVELKNSQSTLEKHINSSTEKVGSKLQEVNNTIIDLKNQLINSDIEDIKKGQIESAERKLTSHLNELGSQHQLYPHYRYAIVKDKNNMRLASVPNNEAALIKYPPTIKAQGKVFIDSQEVPFSASTINFAQRHQKDIVFTIDSAEMFLGSIKDPSQYYAEQLLGKHVLEPEPFPVFPTKITVDGKVIRDYIELKTDEIMDDGTRIMSNREEKDSYIRYIISANETGLKGNCQVYFDGKSNSERYLYYQESSAIAKGCTIEIESFKEPKLFIRFNKKSILSDEYREYTLQLFKWITTIEKYYNIQFPLFDRLSEDETGFIEYLYNLIVGCVTAETWQKIEIPITKNEDSIVLENIEYDVEYNEVEPVQILGVNINVKKHVQVFRAQIEDYEKIRRKLDIIDKGDTIKITLIPSNGEGLFTETICSPDTSINSDIINISESHR